MDWSAQRTIAAAVIRGRKGSKMSSNAWRLLTLPGILLALLLVA
jgi:hypothetical protein